ncbi:nicotinate-nucleotide adenylyltransferase [Paenibacillus polysaccharolyticus]|uniref:Probable nicotinate-nucleotide adenylyltransferase n=2 Tax=Paenibacillus TaxID=44249 RepID=A0A1G5AW33_9BACL|nr:MULTISPECIES: nicotinate-nucleotide adenylyltransferase [Paenibacillus]MBY0204255.1 nicotinate-nucleotide adenylyltransferase [Paenibacillus cucumis (ex Kampfer et al. 2016)]MCP1132583.1 nicotinate-nucleotide adenylyltransferase [Paenibacillus polysaccharolyticus]MDP9699322.1 nicotinate-nucleotide adenylyltransferase [Paenibacillus intestini]SCX82040.1 nicotinate-nucleotide adenylyltransferase [Paenibacillus polysaccharolyticus]
MKIGIMGGTFDPIHMGHLLAAEAARDSHALDEIWFMPSHVPPHKPSAGATGQQRLEMTELAVKQATQYEVLGIEMELGGVSYTIDTMRELWRRFPEHEFYFIIGADMVNYLPKWEEIEELASKMTFIGVGRPGFQLHLDDLPDALQGRVLLAEMPLVDISSTAIRRRLAKGHSVRFMIPDAVHQYIVRSGLYGTKP